MHINSNGTGGGNWASTSTWIGGVVPVDPNVAHVVAGDTIDEVPERETCILNDGTIVENHGTITENSATGIVSYNYGIVTTNNGLVSYLMILNAQAGPTSISPTSFVGPDPWNVKDGEVYNVNNEPKVGTLKKGTGAMPRVIANQVMPYNDNWGRYDDNVGRKAR